MPLHNAAFAELRDWKPSFAPTSGHICLVPGKQM